MSQPLQRRALYFLLVNLLLDSVGFGLIMPVIPQLIMELTGEGIGAAARYSGWLMLLFALVNFVAMPILGNLGDRFGRRPVLLVSLLALGINTLLTGLATSLAWLFVARVITGACSAAYGTANAYVADISPPEQRAQNFAVTGAAFGLGFIVGPAIGGMLGELGPRVPFFAAAAISFANVVYGYFVLPESLAPELRRPFEWRRANPFGAVRALRHYPVVSGLVVVLLLYQLAFQVLPSTWNFYTIYRFDWSVAEVGYSLAFSGMLMIFVQVFLVRRVIPRLGEYRSALVGLLFCVAGHYTYAFAWLGWLMYVGMLLGSLSGLVGPSLNAIMSKQVGPRAQGELQGALGSLMSLTGIVGPLLMTQLFGYFSNPEAIVHFAGAPFFASASLMLVALVLLVRQRGRQAAAPVHDAALEKVL
jgi:MFS transporter, DHA1 family, tetracycline resistance protein